MHFNIYQVGTSLGSLPLKLYICLTLVHTVPLVLETANNFNIDDRRIVFERIIFGIQVPLVLETANYSSIFDLRIVFEPFSNS